MYGTNDYEEGEHPSFAFSESTIRKAFIRKVYCILMLQLLMTAAIISLFYFVPSTRMFLFFHPWLCYFSIALFLVTMIAMACCDGMRRTSPTNYIMLVLFTLALSFLLSTLTALYDANAILMAVGITAAICLGITLFAFQTKWDFTVCGGFLWVCILVLLLFGMIIGILAGTRYFAAFKIAHLVYACLGALLFALYLLYDTQLMMGGKHSYAISPEEYIFAALNIYLDIINMFVLILNCIGPARN